MFQLKIKRLLFALVLGGVMISNADVTTFQQAQSVWPKGLDKAMNTLVGFETTFELKANSKVQLNLVAWYSYRVSVNGKFVAFGPARGPKGFFRPDELDLNAFAQVGKNDLLIEVAGYNVPNFYLMEQPPFFKAEVLVDKKVVAASRVSDSSFTAKLMPRVQKVPRFSFQRTFSEYYRLPAGESAYLPLVAAPEPTLIERVVPYADYTLSTLKPLSKAHVWVDKNRPTHADRSLSLPNQKGWFKGFTMDELELNLPYLGQQLAYDKRSAIDTPQCGKFLLKEGESILFDRGFNDTGFPGAVVRVTKPGRLLVTFDEILTGGDVHGVNRFGDCCNIIVWDFSQPGLYEIAAFEPYVMRYVDWAVMSGEMTLEKVTFRAYKNGTARAAIFKASDPALVKIFDAARETFMQNAVDVFMDCPSRERAGWNCDAYFTAPVSTLLTGNTDLERVFEENIALPPAFDDIASGMIPMCYPSDHRDKVFIPNWAMWFVLETDEYLQRSGDRKTIDLLKPRFEKLVKYLWQFRNQDGLLEKLPSWVFVEWSRCNYLTQHVNYPSNMTWADVLEALDRMYNKPEWAAEAKRVRAKVLEQSWNGTWFCDNAVRGADGKLKLSGECTETCQYYAFYHNVATPETHPALWKTLLTDFGPQRYDPTDRRKLLKYPQIWPSNAFIGNYLRLKLLERAGMGSQILRETKGYFLYMADRTGTLWENDTSSASCNHGFASYAAVLLVRSVLGLDNIDTAKKVVKLRSSDVQLDMCEVTLPVPDGQIVYGWKTENGKRVYTRKAPCGWKFEE